MPTSATVFSGAGFLDLGLEWAGWTTVWQVEWDPFRRGLLAQRYPHARQYGDIADVDFTTLPRVDLIAGGFPCTPASAAGKRRGRADERWLWTGMANRATHPRRRNLNDAAARWPTPTAKDADSSGGIGPYRGISLTAAARLWPTPIARDERSYRGARRMPNSQGSDPLVVAAGGRLNPTWVEWLMGAPLGWTDPGCELLATESSPISGTGSDAD